MHALLRTVVIWMLALALPAQGAWVAGLARCGHHTVAASASPALAGHAAHHDHGHHAAAGRAAAPDAATPDTPAGPHTCSLCAACCTMGALLGMVAVLPRVEAAPTVFAAATSAVEPFVVDGLERPPRRLLA